MPKVARVPTALAVVALLGALAASAIAGNDPNKLRANLNGAKEVPDDGDPNGSGTAFINLNGARERVCFNITFTRIAKPLAGHIHKGGKRTAGDIVVPLFERANGASSPVAGCARDVSGSTIRQIRNNPGGYYVNLHNARFPAGVIRGQLKLR